MMWKSISIAYYNNDIIRATIYTAPESSVGKLRMLAADPTRQLWQLARQLGKSVQLDVNPYDEHICYKNVCGWIKEDE